MAKFEVRLVEPNNNIPHGVRYSLTLHDRRNERVLGYDNAHAVKVSKRKLLAERNEWDHKHQKTRIYPYEFISAGQLLEDFWKDVNRVTRGF